MGIRHMVVVLAFFAYTTTYIARIDMSLAVVAMTDTKGNHTVQIFDWNETIKSRILSSFFLGYIFSQIPAGYLADTFSAKCVSTAAFIVITICKFCVTRIIFSTGWIGLSTVRVIEGFAQGCVIPSITPMTGRWLAPRERMYFNQMLFAGIPFGTLIGLLVSGFLVSTKFEWPLLFYSVGFQMMIFTILWVILISDKPSDSKWISDDEKKYIEESLGSTVKQNRKDIKIPWAKIFTNGPFYALIVTHAGRNWGYFVLFTQTPRYIAGVYNIDVKKAGILSAIPYAVSFIAALLFGFIALFMQMRNILSLTWRRKMWSTIALWGIAITCGLLIFTSPTDVNVVVAYLSFASGLVTAAYSGIFANQFDLSPNFAGILMGISTFTGSITALIGPFSVTFIVHDKANIDEWKLVFVICGIVSFTSSLVYIIFGSAEVQPFNDIGQENNHE